RKPRMAISVEKRPGRARAIESGRTIPIQHDTDHHAILTALYRALMPKALSGSRHHSLSVVSTREKTLPCKQRSIGEVITRRSIIHGHFFSRREASSSETAIAYTASL